MTMIQLAQELAGRQVAFEMRIVGAIGNSALEGRMKAAISSAGLTECVTLTGRVPFERAQSEIAQAAIGLCLLHPTPNYLNSLPIKIFEYMRFGLPVVASDFECWRDYVSGVGLMVDVQSPRECADAVQWLLRNPEQMRKWAFAERPSSRRSIAGTRKRENCWNSTGSFFRFL